MKREEIERTVRALISDKMAFDDSELTDEASLTADLGCDSLDAVEIVLELEKEFNIAITDDAANEFKVIKDLFDHVEKALEEAETSEEV